VRLAACFVSATLVGADAKAQRLEYSGSVSAASGTFVFSEPTTSFAFTNALLLAAERWRLGASFPLVLQNSSALTYVGQRLVPTGGPNAGAVRDRMSGERIPSPRRRGGGSGGGGGSTVVDSGAVEGPGPYELSIADPMLDIDAELLRISGGAARVSGQLFVKLPLADVTSGVGTGQFDYGGGLTFAASGRSVFGFAGITHWILGDMPDLPLRDMTSASAGVGRSFGELGRVSVMGSMSGSSAIAPSVDPALSAGVGVGLALRDRRFLNLGLQLGLTESTPDWSLSLGWRIGGLRGGWED